MPSSNEVRRALVGPLDEFRSSLAATLEQIRGALDAQREASVAGETLGSFAAGRIDGDRFHALLMRDDALDPQAVQVIERACEALNELLAEKDELFLVRVEDGASLEAAVADALAHLGRAFGAARVFELARTGRYRESDHAGLLERFPFERWNAAERDVAPPLLVHVAGGDLFADGLARFLDGAVKIVLVVDEPAPVAPLARLITPGTWVAQCTAIDGLAALAGRNGAGIAALVPEGAAQFVHDPDAGAQPWERLTLTFAPDKATRRVGGRSARQQADELAHLRAIEKRPETPAPAPAPDGVAAPAAAAAGEDPIDKLTALLLANANLEDLA